MPVQTTAYSCVFKCGSHVATKRSRMELHEHRCTHNPNNHACITCLYDQREASEICTGTDLHSEVMYSSVTLFYCEIEKRPDNVFIKHCEHWQPRNDQLNMSVDGVEPTPDPQHGETDPDFPF